MIGANGSGKSTLFKLISGYIDVLPGKIFLEDIDITFDPILSKSKVSICFDSPSVLKPLTVNENMEYYNLLFKKPAETISDILEELNLTNFKNYPARKLSFGLTQRLNIATMLLRDTETLIFDEPLNGLDPQSITILRELFLRYKEKGKTLIVSAHLLAEIEKITDVVVILKEGRVVFNEVNPSKAHNMFFLAECENTSLNKIYLNNIGPYSESTRKLRICTRDIEGLEGMKVVSQTQQIEDIYNFLYQYD